MKIMHIEAGRHLYGGARQVLYLALGLQARGIDNVVVCPEGSEMAARVKHAGIPVHPVSMGGDLDFGLIKRLRGIIEERQPDLIHLHSRRGADWLGGLAGRRFADIPVVLSRRVDNVENKMLSRYKYRMFDRVIVISHAIREVLLDAGVPDDKLVVVHSSVKAETWRHSWDRLAFLRTFFPAVSSEAGDGQNQETQVIGVVAQLIERKGHRFVIEALPQIKRQFPHAKLIFFGQGPEHNELVQLAQSYDVSDDIVFAGFRKDINQWLGCLDVFVHPATAEGLGVAVLQAAAAALPIVASEVGGLPEIIENGVSGFLVQPGSVSEIVDRVVQILGDQEIAQQFGEAAEQTVGKNFSVDAMVEGNLAVYRGLLESSPT